MFSKDEIRVPPSLLNFSYKLCVGKHVPNIALYNTPHFGKPGMGL